MNAEKLYKRYLDAAKINHLAFDELIKARTDPTVKGAQEQYTAARIKKELAWTAYAVAQTSETEESHRKAQGG